MPRGQFVEWWARPVPLDGRVPGRVRRPPPPGRLGEDGRHAGALGRPGEDDRFVHPQAGEHVGRSRRGQQRRARTHGVGGHEHVYAEPERPAHGAQVGHHPVVGERHVGRGAAGAVAAEIHGEGPEIVLVEAGEDGLPHAAAQPGAVDHHERAAGASVVVDGDLDAVVAGHVGRQRSWHDRPSQHPSPVGANRGTAGHGCGYGRRGGERRPRAGRARTTRGRRRPRGGRRGRRRPRRGPLRRPWPHGRPPPRWIRLVEPLGPYDAGPGPAVPGGRPRPARVRRFEPSRADPLGSRPGRRHVRGHRRARPRGWSRPGRLLVRRHHRRPRARRAHGHV